MVSNEITGTVKVDKRGYVVVGDSDGRPRLVAKAYIETAASLVGQRVTGATTPEGLVDLAALGDLAAAVALKPADVPAAADGKQFFNPYAFIPAPPRHTAAAVFGDGPPSGHDRYSDDRWTGRIRVNLEVRSPLLIADAGAATWAEGGHGTFPTRSHNGLPVVPASSVKGMLRSAFEAVTASRFGLFDAKHGVRLAFRQQTSQALGMVPARVTDDGQQLEILTGTTRPDADGRVPKDQPQYAAWVRAYGGKPLLTLADLGLTDRGPLPPIKLEVKIRRARKAGNRPFDFWQVVEVLGYEHEGEMLTPARPLRTDQASTGCWFCQTTRTTTGWLHWTNRNFSRKHDERLFFTVSDQPTRVDLTPNLRATWDAAVNSSVDAHRPKEITGRVGAFDQPWKYLGEQPGKTAWSPHLYEPSRQQLGPGSLCYATVTRNGSTYRALTLHPVMIGREPFKASPRELAEAARVEPATSFEMLSPADRVFGWVNTAKGDDQATRGHVRVGFVQPVKASISEFGEDGIPLAILSTPKPTQARFYAADDLLGSPLKDGSAKSDGYRRPGDRRDGDPPGGGLRGRKIYPPHRVAADHWHDPKADPQREFRRVGDQRDDQNRSLTSWVDAGSLFAFDLWVDNLDDAELGALLHVLCLDDDACLRVGGARPLGFGSIHLSVDWDATQLPEPSRFANRYRSLDPPSGCDSATILDRTKRAHSEGLVEVVGVDGAKRILEAFAIAIRGAEGPVHYPRAKAEPDPGGKNYEWFTRNEQVQDNGVKPGRGLSLPAPYAPLPFHPAPRATS